MIRPMTLRYMILIFFPFFAPSSVVLLAAPWQLEPPQMRWNPLHSPKELLPTSNIWQHPLVVIDAGHGGKDTGTHSISEPKVEEKILALATARYLQNYLHRLGFRTNMTRTDDSFLSLQERIQRSNAQKPLAFVSIHYNAAKNELAEGVEIYYFHAADNSIRSADSKQLADAILRRIVQTTLAKTRGVKHGNLAVIRDTNTPAVLVEGGFMTNENEMKLLRDSKYQRRIAWGVALALRDFASMACGKG